MNHVISEKLFRAQIRSIRRPIFSESELPVPGANISINTAN